MGTRHLIGVILDKQFRIAQYGQWDGYPEGQGETVLAFLKTGHKPNKFKQALRASSFYTEDEMTALQKEIEAKGLGDCWQQEYPHMSRDMGAKILQHVQDSGGLKLKNTLGFAGDSLMCEFAYILDLDNKTLEVYRGFNKTPLTKKDRFFAVEGLEKTDGYEPIKLAARYKFNRLPTVAKMSKDVERKS